MIAEEKRQAVLAAIAQAQDETAFNKIAAMVEQLLTPPAPKPIAPPGFARQEGFWMADDFDEPLEDFADYQ